MAATKSLPHRYTDRVLSKASSLMQTRKETHALQGASALAAVSMLQPAATPAQMPHVQPLTFAEAVETAAMEVALQHLNKAPPGMVDTSPSKSSCASPSSAALHSPTASAGASPPSSAGQCEEFEEASAQTGGAVCDNASGELLADVQSVALVQAADTVKPGRVGSAARLHHDANKPLYDGCKLTTAEVMHRFMSVIQRHNISRVATDSLLAVVKDALPAGNRMPRTAHMLKGGFGEGASNVIAVAATHGVMCLSSGDAGEEWHQYMYHVCGHCWDYTWPHLGIMEYAAHECDKCPKCQASRFVKESKTGECHKQLHVTHVPCVRSA